MGLTGSGDWPSDQWPRPSNAPGFGASPPPPGGTAPPGYPPPGGWAPPAPAPGQHYGPPRTNPLAIVSLVAGLANFAFCGVGAVAAVITGHIARRQIKRSNGTEGGKGLATAGLVLGYIGIGLAAALLVFIVVVAANADDWERNELRDEAREYVRLAELNASASGEGALHDPDLLAVAYYDWSEDNFSGDEMRLATGRFIPGATRGDWEAAGWRIELGGDAGVHVCATVPDRAGEDVFITDGRCNS